LKCTVLKQYLHELPHPAELHLAKGCNFNFQTVRFPLNQAKSTVYHRKMATMKAAVIRKPGGPEVLKIETLPVPKPKQGWVLIRIKAFGLNRSELFTRQGLSPGVQFPRVLGIEAAGIVEEAPGGEFKKGDVVATAMGGMGRQWDGGYAEYTCAPASQVQAITAKADWKVLGAVPEMLQTAWGALFKALRLQKGQTLLIRGGTTSVGLAATAIAKDFGCVVASTTRRENRSELLRASGAEHVFIDSGKIAEDVRKIFPKGVDKVLETIGTTTLEDSLQCTAEGGSVCMIGMVGGKWSFDNFSPMESIPSAVNLTVYSGGPDDFMATPLNELIEKIVDGKLKVQIGKVFELDQIVEASQCMEDNSAGGKIVVLT
jgi:NADPH:quinone reductase-like Zn-dependent oxidoreductase